MNEIVPLRPAPELGRTRGAKGGGGSQREPYEAPNTLRAKQVVRAIFLLGEGPQKGLWDGGKSIFIGEPPVPLVAADGSANFPGITWQYRDGSAGQQPFTGVPQFESTTAVGAQVSVAGGPVIRAIDCTNADRLRVTVQVPSLFSASASTGDQNPASVTVAFEWRVAGSGGGWNPLVEATIAGKCVAPYARAYTVAVPTRAVLDIRCRRITPDSTTQYLQNATAWATATAITDRLMEYPGSAMVYVEGDAEQLGPSLPAFTFGVDQLLCWVPTNYNPVTRTYATSGPGTSGGIWNGTFKRAFTTNPAWIFWTCATDTEWGCGRELQGAVDRYALYTIAQYCDELVPDGFGGQEPRYSFNAYINVRDEAQRVLQSIAQAFRGMMYWGGGKIVPVADIPADPVKNVTPANVIGGRFEYEGADINARHNMIKVRWRNPDLGYLQDIEVVQDPVSIAETGRIVEDDYDAFGCTSRGLARRLARWILYTEKYESEALRYRTWRDHANVVPGDILQVADPRRIGQALGGRLLAAATTTTVVLDRQVQLLAGNTYSIRVQLPDGSLSAKLPVTTTVPSTTDTLTIGGAGLPAGNLPDAGAVWVLVVNNAPWLWRVIDRVENEDGTYSIMALRHFNGKAGFVEQGLSLDDESWTIWPAAGQPLPSPDYIDVREWLTGVGITTLVRVTVSWSPVTDRRAKKYRVQALLDGVAVRDAVTDQFAVDFADLSPGIYIFRVQTLGDTSLASAWRTSDPVTVDGRVDAPPNPFALSATGAIHSIVVRWTNPNTRFLSHVEVWVDVVASGVGRTRVGTSTSGSFTHENLPTNATRWYWLRAVDIFGTAAPDFVGPVSATTSYLIAADIADGIIDTAKFAAGIKPTYVIPNTSQPWGRADGDVAVSQADGRLYVRRNGEWEGFIEPLGPGATLTSEQIESLEAAKIAGQITETQIEDDSISTPKLKAGAVETANIAAGAVTTEKLSVGPASGNVIWNSCCAGNRLGWTMGGTVPPTGWGAVGTHFSDANWRVPGFGTGGFFVSGVVGVGHYTDMNWTALDGARVPVAAGEWWEWQARVQAHRCTAELKILWFNAAGAYISEVVVASTGPYAQADGKTIGTYKLLWGKAQAPAGAATAAFTLRMIGEGGWGTATGVAPYIFFTRAQAALASATQTEPKPWGPGGVTEIAGGMIRTNSVTAEVVNTAQLFADAGAFNNLKAGIASFGGLTAAQIMVGELRGYHLAAEEILTQTLQVRDLIIGTQKISAFSVTQLREAHTYQSWSLPPRVTFDTTQVQVVPSVTDVWNAYFDVPGEGQGSLNPARQGLVWAMIYPYGDLNLGLGSITFAGGEGGSDVTIPWYGAHAEWLLDGNPLPIGTPVPLPANADNTPWWHTITLRALNYDTGWYQTPPRAFGWRLLMFRR